MQQPHVPAAEADDGLSEERINAALAETPKGAFALAAIATTLMMAGWLILYIFVFLPRGSVG